MALALEPAAQAVGVALERRLGARQRGEEAVALLRRDEQQLAAGVANGEPIER